MPTADISTARKRLDEAVHKLTQPFVVITKVRPPGGGWRQESVTHTPLIRDLEKAVAGDLTGNNGVASSTTTTVINLDAVEKLAAMRRELADSWNSLIPHSEPLTVDLPLRRSLHVWHTMFVQHLDLPLGKEARLPLERKRWEGWVLQIQRMFDPERTMEFADACPGCGERYVDTLRFYGETTKSGTYIERHPAVIISLREPFKHSSATCSNQSCGMTWDGAEGLALLGRGLPAPKHTETRTTIDAP